MRNTILLILATVVLPFHSACDTRAHAGAGTDAPRTFTVETITKCRADGPASTEFGTSTITITKSTITLGVEDEALAGIALPFIIHNDRFSSPAKVIPTGELFGDITLDELSGTLTGEHLNLRYTFRAIEVTCTVSGTGRQQD